jgi:hypothetical protein
MSFTYSKKKSHSETSKGLSLYALVIQLLPSIYSLGVLLRSLQLLIQLGQFFFKIYSNQIIFQDGYKYVILEESGHASAFMTYIFMSRDIWESDDKLHIAKHECMHVRFLHSIDRLFTEILCVFQWFNPFIYWFRKDLIEVHEYQVDKAVIENGTDSIAYQKLITKYAASSIQISFGNHFNNSLTLNRIKMIAQNKSFTNNSNYRILSLFVAFTTLFCLFGFQSSMTPISTDTDNDFYILPIDQKLFRKGSDYGMRVHPIRKTEKLHTGIDLIAASGTAVLAVQNATVLRIQKSETGYGNNIILGIDETTSAMYAHLKEILVEAGQVLKQGDIIGSVGNTGKSIKPHLHFEIIKNGKKVDPKEYLPNY